MSYSWILLEIPYIIACLFLLFFLVGCVDCMLRKFKFMRINLPWPSLPFMMLIPYFVVGISFFVMAFGLGWNPWISLLLSLVIMGLCATFIDFGDFSDYQ